MKTQQKSRRIKGAMLVEANHHVGMTKRAKAKLIIANGQTILKKDVMPIVISVIVEIIIEHIMKYIITIKFRLKSF